MSNMDNSKLDLVNKAAMEKMGYEKAPDSFTALVMEQVLSEKTHTQIRFKPVIGKWGWFTIVAVTILIFLAYRYFPGEQHGESNFFSAGFLTNWERNYFQPLMNGILRIGNDLSIVALIGATATLILFADRLVGNKLKNRASIN